MTICAARMCALSLSALLVSACMPVRQRVSTPNVPPAAQRAPANQPQSAPAYAPAATLSCKRLDDWVAEIGPLKTDDNRPLDPTMAQGLSWQLLVEDERFVPIFGKPFDQMTQRELTDIGTNTVGPCVMQNQTHVNKNYQNTISNIFRMHTMMMQGLQRARDSHAEFDRMTAEVATLKQTQEDSNRLDSMRRRASLLVINAPGKSAEQFFFAAAQYGSLRSATLSRPIIEQELITASGLKGLRVLIEREEFVQGETERDAKQGVSSDWHTLLPRLHARVHELAVTVAAEETAKYRAFMDATGYGPSSFSKATAYDREVFATNPLVIKLRDFDGQSLRPEFDAFNQLRDQYFVKIMANREKALVEQTPAILAKVARTTTPKELGALYADAVPTDQKDSEAGKAIRTAVDARFDQLLPFNKLSGGLYLSMLYLKDRETIRRLDEHYLSGVREAGGGWEDKAAACGHAKWTRRHGASLCRTRGLAFRCWKSSCPHTSIPTVRTMPPACVRAVTPSSRLRIGRRIW